TPQLPFRRKPRVHAACTGRTRARVTLSREARSKHFDLSRLTTPPEVRLARRRRVPRSGNARTRNGRAVAGRPRVEDRRAGRSGTGRVACAAPARGDG